MNKPRALPVGDLPPKDEATILEQAAAAVDFLEGVRDNRARLAVLDDALRARLLVAAGQVARPDPWAKRELLRAAARRHKAKRREQDERVLAKTGIRQKRAEQVFATPPRHSVPVLAGEGIDQALSEPRQVAAERVCYVCKQRFQELHFFYDSMCAACAELNWNKRHQTADLSGRVAVITGARVKIGYQAAIMLLRAGARVVVATRFPHDAAARYVREDDFSAWADRLQIHGIDLRHTPSVELFARHLGSTLPRLDFIINNACQTVRRPPGFYAHLLQGEQQADGELPQGMRALLGSYTRMRAEAAERRIGKGGIGDPAECSQLALLHEDLDRSPAIFPEGAFDADLQQIDLRLRNSWRLPLAEVSAVELIEVQLVNAVAPFVLNARLKALMLKQGSRDKHIVNVSAMEGQFYRSFKTDKHPHTNMAKAALNMMTRTSARDYVADGIHMNSVDTGWVTDEDPVEVAARKTAEHGFHPPLDIVDGAARICDPILDGHNSGKHTWGQFLKDYRPTDW